MGLFVLALTTMIVSNVKAWTGEINGRVVCDVCGDSSIGPEDHVLEGLSSHSFSVHKVGIFGLIVCCFVM